MIYKVVHANNAPDLEHKVNGSLEAGFVCQGGVAVSVSNETTRQETSRVLAQAMIYYEEKKDD